MKILVTGATGQVGWELCRTLAPLGDVLAPPRSELDLAAEASIRAFVRGHRLDVVVNAGAYTAVDRAEDDADAAMAINARAPAILAEEMRACGGLLVHYSTDYVFDGAKVGAYTEDDEPRPINVYGRSKLAGERCVQAARGAHLIFRTSWVYGLRGSNFLRTILRLAREREQLRIVSDQHGAPTWCRMIAQATAAVLVQARGWAAAELAARSGVYHVAAGGETSWHGFAEAILAAERSGQPKRLQRLEAIPTSEYPARASRPLNSRLDCHRLEQTFGIRLPHWRASLEQALLDGAVEP